MSDRPADHAHEAYETWGDLIANTYEAWLRELGDEEAAALVTAERVWALMQGGDAGADA